MKTLTHISLYLLYAVVPTFASVVQNFDSIGTPYTIKTYDSQPPAAILSGGPTGNFMRLVNAGVTWQQNEIAFDKTDNGLVSQADIRFSFRMGGVGVDSADGIGIAIFNTAIVGASGNPYYFSEEAQVDGLGIGLDIFNNQEQYGNNHVSVHFPNMTTQEYPAVINLSDNYWHQAVIHVDFLSKNITMSLDGLNQFSTIVPLLSPFEPRLAFSGRTGAGTDNHDIDNISAVFTTVVPEPSTYLAGLSALGMLGFFGWRNRK